MPHADATTPPGGLHLLVIFRLGRAKAVDKLSPLLHSRRVARLTVVRHAAVPLQSPRLEQVIHAVGLTDSGPVQPVWASLRNLAAAFWNGLRLARRRRPDAVLAYNLLPYGLIAWTVARLTGRGLVISLIGVDFNHRLRLPVLGAFLKHVLKGCDSVAVFGPQARQSLLAAGLAAEKVLVLPNTVDTGRFCPNPALAPDCDLVYIGNLFDFKRIDTVLAALKRVRQTLPAARLRIVGDGPERPGLQALAAELGVNEAVEFTGWRDNTPELLQRSRILLLLSEHEGLPAVVLEALACGLPVIATRVGSVDTVLQDGRNGFLLDAPAQPEDVAGLVVRLLSDREEYHRFSQAALQVRQSHDYAQAGLVWDEILANIEQRPRRQAARR